MKSRANSRLLAWVCSAAMVFSTLPSVTVFAGEEEAAAEAAVYAGSDMLEEIAQENAEVIGALGDTSTEVPMMQTLEWAPEEDTASEDDPAADGGEDEYAYPESDQEEADLETADLETADLFDDPEMFDEVDEELELYAAEGIDETVIDEEIAEEELTEGEEAAEETVLMALENGEEIIENGISFQIWEDSAEESGFYAEVTGYDGESSDLDIPDEISIRDEGQAGTIIDIPVREIADYAFEDEEELEYITIGSNVTRIGDGAFRGCNELYGIEFEEGSGLRYIGSSAFENTWLEDIDLPDSVSYIGPYAFWNTDLEGNLRLPSSLTSIEESVFENTEIESVTIPASVQKIGPRAFLQCWELASVTFEAGSLLTEIGESAFENTVISSFTVPAGVRTIGQLAFAYNYNLKNFGFEAGSQLTQLGYGVFIGCDLSSFTVPAGVSEIPARLLLGNNKLASVVFAGNSVRTIGEFAFSGTGLTSLELPSSVTTIASSAYAYSKLKTAVIPASVTTIQYAAFAGCTSLTDVSFGSGSGLAVIPRAAFYGTAVEHVVLPASVNKIEKEAFLNAPKLAFIQVGGIGEIGEYALGFSTQNKAYTKTPGFTIKGKIGCAGETYAKANGFIFVPEDPYLALNVSNKTVPLKLKKSFTPSVTRIYEGDSIYSWSSSNAKAVVVDGKTGKVTAKKSGTAVITAKTMYGAVTTFKVRVQKSDVLTKNITQIPKKQTLQKGKTLKLNPLLSPITSSQKLTFTSSNKKIVKVSRKGVIKARKKGKAVITVRSGKKKKNIRITVK